MSALIIFESEYFVGNIEGFENARRNYANASSKNKNNSKLPKKVRTFIIVVIHSNNIIKVYTAVLNSTRLQNENVLLSKKDCNDQDFKTKIDRALAANHAAIKKFLNDGSSALTLQFVEKRTVRKRSGKSYII